MILVTAANGNQGRSLIPRLLGSGATVRACVQSAASAAYLRAAGVRDIVVGDMADPDVIAQAMTGVATVYHVGPTLHPQERAMGFAAVDAARACGVRHFVFSSALHAITTDLIQHEIKRDIEEHLLSSGLEFTILQPTNYMLAHRLQPALERGVFMLSWSLDRRQSLVDPADVAEVAATVLLGGEDHLGATYELASPGRYTAYDLAAIIGEALGRDISVEQISADTFLRRFQSELESFDYRVRLARAISARYSSHDFVGNPNVLTWLLGRPPTTWAEFVQAQIAAHRGAAGRAFGQPGGPQPALGEAGS